MPFQKVESTKKIGFNKIRIKNGNMISVPKHLRIYLPLKVEVFFDKQNHLLGLKSADKGYTFSDHTIHVRPLKQYNIMNGIYEAYWDKEQQILIAKVDLID